MTNLKKITNLSIISISYVNKKVMPGKYGIIFGLILILGLIFRFSNLDRRIYWHDEALTSLRASGFSYADVITDLSNGDEISSTTLLKYQIPSQNKTIQDSVEAMISNAPHHPPLYYLLSHYWIRLIGSTPGAMRSLAGIISILSIPAMFWLANEIFASRRTAVLATALLWLSPIQVLLAREARQYSLWVVTTILASALLLRALRKGSIVNWTLYSIITILGYYTHTLYLFLVFIHSVFVVFYSWSISGRNALTEKSLVKYFIASAVAIIAYIPWILVIINNKHIVTRSSQWVTVRIPVDIYVQRIIARLSGVFIDLDSFSNLLQGVVIIPVLFLIVYSFFYLWNSGPKESWLFVFLLIFTPLAFLTLLDLISGGYRATVGRYLVPCYVGFPLLVVHLLTERLEISKSWRPKLWLGVIVLLFSMEILSNVFIVQAESWWDKGSDYGYSQMVEIISETENPLLIIDGSRETHLGYMLGLSHELPSHVYIKWGEASVDQLCCHYSDIFVYQPSFDTFEELNKEPEFNLKNVVPGLLWHLN